MLPVTKMENLTSMKLRMPLKLELSTLVDKMDKMMKKTIATTKNDQKIKTPT